MLLNKKIQADTVIFDIDNTLYNYQEYYEEFFRQASKNLAKKYSVNEKKIYQEAIKLFQKYKSTYPQLFDQWIKKISVPEKEITQLVKQFNNLKIQRLTPYKNTKKTLSYLEQKGIKLGIISDGNPKRQTNKLKKLGLEKYFEFKIFTSQKKPKTTTEPFEEIIEKLNSKPEKTIYVGYNPDIDFKGAKKTGMNTIRILKGEHKEKEKNQNVDIEIKDISKLKEILGLE